MSEKSSKGLAVGLLIVGLVAGLAGGYFINTPEINRLNTELSASEDLVNDLEGQVASLESSLDESLQTITDLNESLAYAQNTISALQSDMQALESDLENAQDKIDEYEYLSAQLEKDSAFLKLQGNARSRINVALTLEDVIAVWTEVQEASLEVDPAIADTIDPLINMTGQIMAWMENTPSEYASEEEWATWLIEGMTFNAGYILQYYFFEATYVNAIQAHIEAVSNI